MNQAHREMEEAVADWLNAYEGHERYLQQDGNDLAPRSNRRRWRHSQ